MIIILETHWSIVRGHYHQLVMERYLLNHVASFVNLSFWSIYAVG